MIEQKWIHRLNERWSNKVWLVTGLLLSAALLFAANWEAGRQERVRMDAFRGDVADLARISESIIAGRLREYDHILLVLRDSYAADPKSFTNNILLLRSGPLADRDILVVLNDSKGYVTYTDATNAKPGLYMGWSAYFRYFADGAKDGFHIAAPVFGRVTNRYSIPMVRPIYDKQGGFLGVVALSVRQDAIANFGSRLQLSGDTTVTVVTHDGSVAARSRDLAKLQGTKIHQELLAPMLKEDEGVFSSRNTIDGFERVIAYRHIAETPLVVYVEASPANLLHETSLQRTLFNLSAGFTSIVIMATILLYLKGRKTTLQLIDSLRRSKEQEYETLTGTSLDGFYIADISRRILDTNNTLCKLLGYSQEEFCSLRVSDIEATESQEQAVDHFCSIMEASSDRFEARYRCKNGSIIDVEISAQFVKEPDGRFFVFVSDITERKIRENELQRKNAELERFTYTVSHDLKSPIITIKGFTGALEKDLLKGNYERMPGDLKRVSAAADKMNDLLRDLLELSTIGRIINTPESVDMNQLVDDVLAQLAGPLNNRNISVTVQPGLPTLFCDRVRMAEVVQNLLENAINSMGDRADPQILFGVRPEDTGRVFFVQDNGIGIDEKYHQIIFGLFNKLDAKSKGTGIGLALVRRIVEVHGGRVWVESEGAGMGSRFCFTVGYAKEAHQ